MFIRPHHKRQYEQMVDALRGQSVSADNIPQVTENPYSYSMYIVCICMRYTCSDLLHKQKFLLMVAINICHNPFASSL